MKNKSMFLVKALLFVLFGGLVIYGQKNPGQLYLMAQLLGLFGIILLLWDYNRKFV